MKAQVIVAANEPLPFTQQDIQIHGHAIECRINAENPKQKLYAKVTGRLITYIFQLVIWGCELTPLFILAARSLLIMIQ